METLKGSPEAVKKVVKLDKSLADLTVAPMAMMGAKKVVERVVRMAAMKVLIKVERMAGRMDYQTAGLMADLTVVMMDTEKAERKAVQ